MNTIGLDIGTSSVKALLVSPNGEILKVSCPEYPFQTPKPLWAETDPKRLVGGDLDSNQRIVGRK